MDEFDLPGYRLVRILSETNMSVVYQAEDLAFDSRPVAVKVLKPSLAQDPGYTDRFRRELAAAGRLNHPNIVAVYSRGSTLRHLVMPYIDGSTLAEVLAKAVRLDLPRTVRIVRQVASALDHAHARGWVHRDVKPGNVMLHAGSDHAYLIDFGIAAELEVERRTEVGQTVGTPGYLAPELRSDVIDTDRRPITPQADIYSLGVVAYRCLTGRLPHDEHDVPAAEWLSRQGAPPRPVTALRPELPSAVDQALARALAPPAQRYATCAELAEALASAANVPPPPVHRELTIPPGQPDATPPLPPRRPSRLGAARNPLLAGALAIVLIVGGIAVWRAARGGDGGPDLTRVPPALIGDCTPGSSANGFPGADSVLLCQDGRQQVWFSVFDDRSAMDLAYAGAVREAGIPRGTGDCTSTVGAEHRYPGAGDQVGRVVCWSGGGTGTTTVTTVWTDDERRTVAMARTRASDDEHLAADWARWVGIPAFPTREERKLIDLVDKPDCRRSEAGTLESFRGVVAAIECDANSKLATSVGYYRFADVDSLRHTYRTHVDENNPPGGVLCADNPPGFVGNRGYDLRSVEIGEMLCYPGERGSPTLEWTVEPLRMLARVTGTDPADVAEWWRRGIGLPRSTIVARLNETARPPFPDEAEHKLLTHVPEASRVDCLRPAEGQVRDDVGEDNAADVVAVVCGPTDGAWAVYYYEFPDLGSMNASYTQNLGTSGPRCTAKPKGFAGDAPYTLGAAKGRLGCGLSDGRPFLVWTSDRLRTTTFAVKGYDTDSLLEWWRTDAGPR